MAKKSRNMAPKATPRSRSGVSGRDVMKAAKAPVALGQLSVNRPPAIQSKGLVTCIKHRENFGTVYSSDTGFNVQTFAVNPGIASTFPWLSSIANNFVSYRFRSLSFEYMTRSASSATGTVALAVDYDARDAPPSSFPVLASYKDERDDVCWKIIRLPCSRADMDKLPQRYVRAGPVTNTDIKTYDVGNLQVCTDNVSGAYGQLYVDYEVELMTPKISSSVVGGTFYSNTSVSNTTPFGDGVVSNQILTGVQPFQVIGGVLSLTQDFTGLLCFYWQTTGSTYTDVTSSTAEVSVIACGSGPTWHVWEPTLTVLALSVQGSAGQTISVSLSGGTVTSCSACFGNASPDAL